MRITRAILTVRAYPPTRSLPFAATTICSVWLCGAVYELCYTVPDMTRRVGAPTIPTEMTPEDDGE
jgi:hypothetical protein